MSTVRRVAGSSRRWRGVAAAVWACAAVLLLFAPLSLAAGTRKWVPVGLEVIGGWGSVNPGSSASYSMSCPAKTPRPIGGMFRPLDLFGSPSDSQLALAASYPVGRRSWRLEISNLGQVAQGYQALVVCVGAQGARFAYPHASSVIAPGGTGGETAMCPRSAPNPLGGLFYVRGGGPTNDAVVNWIDPLYDWLPSSG